MDVVVYSSVEWSCLMNWLGKADRVLYILDCSKILYFSYFKTSCTLLLYSSTSIIIAAFPLFDGRILSYLYILDSSDCIEYFDNILSFTSPRTSCILLFYSSRPIIILAFHLFAGRILTYQFALRFFWLRRSPFVMLNFTVLDFVFSIAKAYRKPTPYKIISALRN